MIVQELENQLDIDGHRNPNENFTYFYQDGATPQYVILLGKFLMTLFQDNGLDYEISWSNTLFFL